MPRIWSFLVGAPVKSISCSLIPTVEGAVLEQSTSIRITWRQDYYKLEVPLSPILWKLSVS